LLGQAALLRRRLGSPEAGWVLLGLILSTHMPILGELATLFAFARQAAPSDPSPLEELKELIESSAGSNLVAGLTQEEQRREAREIDNQLESQYGEIFSLRSLVEEGVSERSQIRQLKEFLRNPRSDAYHLAQAEVARLVEHFTVQVAESRERFRLNPHDLEAHHELAQWHLRYADSGLLEENLEKHYLELTINRYRDIIYSQPNELRWRLLLIEILLSRGRYAEVIETSQKALKKDPENPQVWTHLLEAHFQAARGGAHEPVRQLFMMLAKLRKLSPKNLQLRELIQFWTKSEC